MITTSSSCCKPNAFYSIWKQPLVNGGAHAEQAVQDDAEQEQTDRGPCKRGARPTGDDVSANESHDDVHNGHTTKTDGMRALSRNAERITVLA